MPSYAEQLKDPRWQRKRLEIMERADFTCEYCEDKTTTLHVHHLRYKRGAAPWDYENSELKCACEVCHKKWHLIEEWLELAMTRFSIAELEMLMGFGWGISLMQMPDNKLGPPTPYVAFGMLAAFNLTWTQCKDLIGPDRPEVTGRELHARMIEIHGVLEE